MALTEKQADWLRGVYDDAILELEYIALGERVLFVAADGEARDGTESYRAKMMDDGRMAAEILEANGQSTGSASMPHGGPTPTRDTPESE